MKCSPLFFPSIGFLIIVAILIIGGCQSEYPVDIRYDGGSYTAKTYDVFDGVLNGQAVNFIYGPGQFKCVTGLVLYYDNDQAAMNQDQTQATCTGIVYQRVETAETNISLVSNG